MTNLVDAINNSNENVLSKKLGKITRQRLRAEKRKMLKEKRSFLKNAAMTNKEMGGSAQITKIDDSTDWDNL